ncbi:hypothetical protein ACIQMJ_11305 [Actinosynnema sp. NPDC091369]
MTELRKLAETFVPWLVEKTTIRFVVYGLFWLTTAFVAWWFVTGDAGPERFVASSPLMGVLIAAAPVVLVWQTSRRGLSRVHGFVFGTVLFLTTVPGFVIGRAQAQEETPTGFALVEVAVFLVWGAVFPTMVDRVDRRFRRLRGPVEDPKAEIRVMVMRIGLAVLIMLMANEMAAGFRSYVALVTRVKWTAAVACASCLVCPLLSFAPGGVVWDATWADVVAAVVSAAQWRGPLRNSQWRGGLP